MASHLLKVCFTFCRHLSGRGERLAQGLCLLWDPEHGVLKLSKCKDLLPQDSQSCHQIETKNPKPVTLDTPTGIRVFRELQTRELEKRERFVKFCLYRHLMFNASIRDFHGTKFSYFLKRTIKAKTICMTRSETENKHINLL